MKTRPSILFLVAALTAGSICTANEAAPASNVTVVFKDADKFTDARSRFGGSTDQSYLDILSEHLQKVASRQLQPGQKLEITVTDVDLAGDFLPVRPQMDQVRIIKDVYIPRVQLSFKLTDASGKVLKSGDRQLSDMNFMNNSNIIGRNEPLFYDKALLTAWVEKEFKS